MPRQETDKPEPDDLRRRAEEQVRERETKVSALSEVEALRLLHELEVHQIELEMQNAELRSSRLESEEAAARYTGLYDFAPVAYVTLGEDGTIRTANFAAAGLFGLERSRLTGGPFQVFVSPPDRVAIAALLDRAGRNGAEREICDLALETPKGVVQVHLMATRLERAEREILLAMQDVTERRKREEELKGALRLLNVSQRIARLGTFTVDIATGNWTSSAALDEIFGVEGRRFKRTMGAFLDLVHPEDREVMARYLRSGMRAGEPFDREYRIVHPQTGEVLWLHGRGDVEYDAMEPVRLVGTVQDITDSKHLQQERAGLLREAQAARAEAEAANRSKDAFMATLSHELRNPLTPITNCLHIIQRTKPGSEQASRAFEVIDRQVHHLARLVDDLLDATRIASGKLYLRRERIDLNDLARSMVEDHRALFDRNGVKLDLTPAPAPVLVEGDWHRLAQVLGNVLQNAAKFCKHGGATSIAVSEDARESAAVVRVKDDGMGMAPEMMLRLFQPFMQADTTLDRRKGGLGLGMALAKQLVELHGGEIRAHSAGLGMGAEFVLLLPLAPETAAKNGAAAEPAHVDHGAPIAARRRVLVIEDNVDAAETLRELLELHLHEVWVAHSGPEGLAKAREARPEVVLCDIGLPGMDGYEVAKAMRADAALEGIYLVALSGYALSDDVRQAMESGFHAHVAKPPRVEDLDRILAEAPARPEPLDAPLGPA